MPMTNREKIIELEKMLEDIIRYDSPNNTRYQYQVDALRKIETVVALQNTISNLRHKQFVKDHYNYKGEIE